jgi:glycogen debranching enzyme
VEFDLNLVPFSRYGSYIVFSHMRRPEGMSEELYLRTIHGDAFQSQVFRIELTVDGRPVPCREVATPAFLRLEGDAGYAEICFAGQSSVRVRCLGTGVRLAADQGSFQYALPRAQERWEVNSFATRTKYMLTSLQGTLNTNSPWSGTHATSLTIDLLPEPGTGTAECAIDEYVTSWTATDDDRTFEECLAEVKAEFQAWLDSMATVPERYAEAREIAAYIDWSCVVAPSGHLTRPAMYMSKNWMTGIWSWDHCFNAIALAYKNPQLAWDQFMIMFDNQDEHGALPDQLNDKLAIWNFSKPPIHGWTLQHLLRRTDWITADRLREAYEPLCRWTEWWLTYRDDDRDGVPQYHHGNDSGWDNCTAFMVAPPVEGADLSAFLVIQMDVLAEVARALGKMQAAKDWKAAADALLDRLLAHSWRGDRFVAPRSGDHTVYESDTLFHFLPIVLGKRLPVAVREKLSAGLKEEGRFLTAHGLATESVQSPWYEADGYWRGPIWAPSTMLLIDGLAASGERPFASELARRFCDMAARSGMAENYDALTGEGLRDRAYTWTSSVFLVLAHEYLAQEA